MSLACVGVLATSHGVEGPTGSPPSVTGGGALSRTLVTPFSEAPLHSSRTPWKPACVPSPGTLPASVPAAGTQPLPPPSPGSSLPPAALGTGGAAAAMCCRTVLSGLCRRPCCRDPAGNAVDVCVPARPLAPLRRSGVLKPRGSLSPQAVFTNCLWSGGLHPNRVPEARGPSFPGEGRKGARATLGGTVPTRPVRPRWLEWVERRVLPRGLGSRRRLGGRVLPPRCAEWAALRGPRSASPGEPRCVKCHLLPTDTQTSASVPRKPAPRPARC